MNFDDYNYKAVNNYVLVSAPKDLTSKVSDLQRLIGENETENSEALSQKLKLTQKSLQDRKEFKHDLIEIETEDNEQELAIILDAEQ